MRKIIFDCAMDVKIFIYHRVDTLGHSERNRVLRRLFFSERIKHKEIEKFFTQSARTCGEDGE